MTPAERDAVIDDCIREVLSLCHTGGRDDEEQQRVELITHAACFRLLLMKSQHTVKR